MVLGLQPSGLPHSEISGSQVVCTYPKLIAAYHVLLRLPEPRHPPFALSFFFFDVKLLSTINGRSQNLYIVNLIVFARLIRNTIKVSQSFAFTFVNTSKIAFLNLMRNQRVQYRSKCCTYSYQQLASTGRDVFPISTLNS